MSASREHGSANSAAQWPALAAARNLPRAECIFVVLLTIVGGWLRLLHLGSKGLWLDEAITLQLANMPWKDFIASWWHGDAAYQSLYYLLMRFWSPGPFSEFWVRLPSALFGIAAIPVIYLVAKRLTNSTVALAAAALLTFSVTDVYYSQEARSYTLAILLVLLSHYFFLQAIEQNRNREWLLWSCCSVLAVYAHDFAVLALLAQPVSLMFARGPIPWRRFFPYGLLIAVGVAPLLSFVFRVPARQLQYSWMPKASPRELFQLATFLGGTHLRLVLVSVLWVAAIVAIIRSRRQAGNSEAFWHGALILLWFLLPIALLALASTVHPVFVQRYMLFSLPAALILAALGLLTLHKWRTGLLLVIVLCASSAIAVFKQYREPREDWRSATNAVLAAADPGDAILFCPDYLDLPFDYYRNRYRQPPALNIFSTQPVEAGKPDYRMSQIEAGKIHSVWIVLSGNSPTTEDLRERDPRLADQLQSRYGPPAIRHFKDITVLRFAGANSKVERR